MNLTKIVSIKERIAISPEWTPAERDFILDCINAAIRSAKAPGEPQPSAETVELLDLANEFESGLRKCAASGYEEYGPEWQRKRQLVIDALREKARPGAPQEAPDNGPGLRAAMDIVGNMRQSEAGLFDAAHSGQRGEDRSNALYDAYVAIRSALSRPK